MTSDNHVTGPVSDAMIEAATFERNTMRHNIKEILRSGRDIHPDTMLDRIMAAIPVRAMKSQEQASVHSHDEELVARAICERGAVPNSWGSRSEHQRNCYRKDASAAIAALSRTDEVERVRSSANTLNVFSDGSWTVTSGIDAEVEATHSDHVVSLEINRILASLRHPAKEMGE